MSGLRSFVLGCVSNRSNEVLTSPNKRFNKYVSSPLDGAVFGVAVAVSLVVVSVVALSGACWLM